MKLENITVKYGEKTVFENFSIEFPDNKISCILGASGCGKTTLLNVAAGIIPYTGRVEKVSDNIGYIFQNPVLLNHLTIEKNIEFVLKSRVKDKAERQRITDSVLEKVGLFSERGNYPASLSGGMAQRLSLARAFACKTDIMLMDEPFKALDISLKKSIISLFSGLYDSDKKTVLLVTHDIDEAVLLADKIVVIGSNSVIYEKLLERRGNRAVGDFSDVRNEIYGIL
jgi:NitT/TauT family transport system ATP-binding protein